MSPGRPVHETLFLSKQPRRGSRSMLACSSSSGHSTGPGLLRHFPGVSLMRLCASVSTRNTAENPEEEILSKNHQLGEQITILQLWLSMLYKHHPSSNQAFTQTETPLALNPKPKPELVQQQTSKPEASFPSPETFNALKPRLQKLKGSGGSLGP